MSTLHITNGDCAASTLRTFLADPVVITADALHDGPAPDVPLDEWYDIRTRPLSDNDAFLSSEDAAFSEVVRQRLEASDRAIADAARHDEVVLWFEHDLFDQLLLIRTLDLLRQRIVGSDVSRTLRVSLICIDRFPGVDRFIGLGQLSGAQLETLTETRRPVTPVQYDTATRAWASFRAADPVSLDAWVRLKPDPTIRGGDDPLPFLRPALKRFLEEYPSTTNGLSRTENAILAALEAAPLDGGALFPATQAREAAPFMGDWSLFRAVHELSRARVPLVTVSPPTTNRDLRGHTIALTAAGRDVLAGRTGAIALNGIDTWRGGVHLVGANQSPWAWDPARETLVSFSR